MIFRKGFLRVSSPLLIGGALVFVLSSLADVRSVQERLGEISTTTLVVGVLGTTLAFSVSGWRWFFFLRKAGFPHSVLYAIGVRLVGQAFNTLVPGGLAGDLVQVFLVCRRPRLSARFLLATVLADRAVGLLGLAVLLVSTVILVGSGWRDIYWVSFVAVAALAIAIGLLFVGYRSRSGPLVRVLARIRWIAYLGKILRDAAYFGRDLRLFSRTLALALVGQLLASLAPWMLLRDLAAVPFLYSLPVLALAAIVALLPVSIGGLGVREWVIFAATASFGVELEGAIAVSFAWFAITAVVASVLGLAALVMLPKGVSIIRGRPAHRRISRPSGSTDAGSG